MRKTAFLLGSVLLLLPSVLLGQKTPGINLTVEVIPNVVALPNNEFRIEYRLTNQPSSREQLFTFTVDAPASVLSINTPEPRDDWSTSTTYRTQSVARWAVLGDQMQPGQSSPVLFFRARGIPTIVASWMRGYAPPPPVRDTDEGHVPPSDPLVENSIRGSTVGVESLPADVTPVGLTTRTRNLTETACGSLGWISNAGICESLRSKLREAEAALARDDRVAARGQLRSFISELDAQRGKSVNESAYWLLKTNAEYILGKL